MEDRVKGIMDVMSSLLVGTLSVLISVSAVAGQSSVELGPLVGYYLPTGSYESATVHMVGLPTEPQDLKGGTWGGEARIWFGGRIGVQIQVAASSTELGPFFPPGGPFGPTSARTTVASVQLLYELLLDPLGYRIWVGAGPGVIRHGGDAYAQVAPQTDVTAAIGVGGRVPIRGGLGVAAGVTALFYSYNVPMPSALRGNGDSLQKGFQRDALFYVGLNWMWG